MKHDKDTAQTGSVESVAKAIVDLSRALSPFGVEVRCFVLGGQTYHLQPDGSYQPEKIN